MKKSPVVPLTRRSALLASTGREHGQCASGLAFSARLETQHSSLAEGSTFVFVLHCRVREIL